MGGRGGCLKRRAIGVRGGMCRLAAGHSGKVAIFVGKDGGVVVHVMGRGIVEGGESCRNPGSGELPGGQDVSICGN